MREVASCNSKYIYISWMISNYCFDSNLQLATCPGWRTDCKKRPLLTHFFLKRCGWYAAEKMQLVKTHWNCVASNSMHFYVYNTRHSSELSYVLDSSWISLIFPSAAGRLPGKFPPWSCRRPPCQAPKDRPCQDHCMTFADVTCAN